MTFLSLELNDAKLRLARGDAAGGELIAESEGYAVIEGAELLTGIDAKRRARLRPIFSYNRFWRDLGVNELPRGNELARTPADLAFAHAEALLGPHRANHEGLLLALPAGYTRDQLGLLLGVLGETGLAVDGLVDAAVAAVALQPAGARVLHLDLELHNAVLTLLENGAELRRSQGELLPRHGLLALEEAWVEAIAVTFVRRTRFDPLHDARNEQALWNGLPQWLAALEQAPAAEVELGDRDTLHKVEFARDALLAAAEPRYAALLAFVQQQCPAGVQTDVVLSDRAAAMPGLLGHLSTLPSATVRALPPGAAALGALQYVEEIRRPPGQVSLVTRLKSRAVVASASPASGTSSVAEHDRPTHVLFHGRAHPISTVPLLVGAAPDHARALRIPAGPGISRTHCAIVGRDGHAWLEDRSTYGTLLNGSPVRGAVVLRVGDQVRVGSPGVTLDLIRIVED
jgi:hypothetical protein